MQQQIQIININDGEVADPHIVKEFELDELCRDGKYNFVGFINKKDKLLVSCPKHFVYKSEADIKLIVHCIIKSFRTSDKGSSEKVNCNIPYRAYMEISAKNGKSYWGSFGSSNPYGTFKKIGFFHNRNTSSVFDLFAKESEAQF